MEKLKYVCKSKDELYFESNTPERVISQAINILYDAQLKRCRCKIEQYYVDGKEYCRIIGKYKETFTNKIIEYIISGFSNDWGNFINVQDTLRNNKIEIKEVE